MAAPVSTRRRHHRTGTSVLDLPDSSCSVHRRGILDVERTHGRLDVGGPTPLACGLAFLVAQRLAVFTDQDGVGSRGRPATSSPRRPATQPRGPRCWTGRLPPACLPATMTPQMVLLIASIRLGNTRSMASTSSALMHSIANSMSSWLSEARGRLPGWKPRCPAAGATGTAELHGPAQPAIAADALEQRLELAHAVHAGFQADAQQILDVIR